MFKLLQFVSKSAGSKSGPGMGAPIWHKNVPEGGVLEGGDWRRGRVGWQMHEKAGQ